MENCKRKLIDDPRYRARLEACRTRPSVLVALTRRCNLACSYCSTRKLAPAPADMDLALARSIVDQCAALGWPLSFGQTYEPFLHPEIERVIAYVLDKGLAFSSATNGLAIRESAYDLPMSLLVSYSAAEEDYRHRGTRLPYAAYQSKILGFLRHRICRLIPGTISVQIADYGIFRDGPRYDREIADVAGIFDKTARLAIALGVDGALDLGPQRGNIAARRPLVLFREGGTVIQVQPTKILPNAYDAFLDMEEPGAPRGYCDSCHVTLSLQADGTAAFCCCDPTARAAAGRITAETDLPAFWLGKRMTRIREGFDAFKPLHAFCTQCLANVSEHIKPLLTVADPGLVAAILRDHGVGEDLPWFSFPGR